MFGCDHVEVGMAATKKWGFPDVLVQGMDYLNRPPDDSEFKKIAALVALCDRIASIAVQGKEQWEAYFENDWSLDVLGIEQDQLRKLMDDSTEAIAAAAVFSF